MAGKRGRKLSGIVFEDGRCESCKCPIDFAQDIHVTIPDLAGGWEYHHFCCFVIDPYCEHLDYAKGIDLLVIPANAKEDFLRAVRPPFKNDHRNYAVEMWLDDQDPYSLEGKKVNKVKDIDRHFAREQTIDER